MTELHDATTASTTAESAAGCPVVHGADPSGRPTNGRWWPERLNLKVLAKNPAVANPLGADFDYAGGFDFTNRAVPGNTCLGFTYEDFPGGATANPLYSERITDGSRDADAVPVGERQRQHPR